LALGEHVTMLAQFAASVARIVTERQKIIRLFTDGIGHSQGLARFFRVYGELPGGTAVA